MCEHCGCGVPDAPADHPAHPGQVHDHGHGHPHEHSHDHDHVHPHQGHPEAERRTVLVREGILAKNDRIAERNRGYFEAKGVFVLNLLSSPGSGKTTLIERMAADLKGRLRLGVVVGDLATDNDARRLEAAGVPAVQVTTGTVCHLDAEMVAGAMTRLPLGDLDLLIIENVGNLVCPAAFDLGESWRVVLMSVTEGEDKPLKYPTIFRDATAVLLTKTDLAAAAGFDRESALHNIGRAAPTARRLELSARTGQGMQAWYEMLQAAQAAHAAAHR
jgi:hydrogenase nickel incorporation protein HypB